MASLKTSDENFKQLQSDKVLPTGYTPNKVSDFGKNLDIQTGDQSMRLMNLYK